MSTCPTCGHPAAFNVLGWLERRDVRLRPAPAYVLRYLFEHAGELGSVKAWADAVRCPRNTIRWWCQKNGLPTPTAWLALARGLHMADELRGPRKVERVAFRLGYDGHGAISHAIRRTFGLSATEARGLSADALADRWWSRHASPSTARRAA
jgi:AraC-like DNA-binding protein